MKRQELRSNELYHYGVLGMKWGVHKAKAKNAISDSSKKRKIKKQRIKDSRNRSRLSDKDLDAKIERLQKEKKLKDLTASEVTPGRAWVKDVMGKTSTKLISTTVATVGAAYIANKLIDKQGGSEIKTINWAEIGKDIYKQVAKPKK